MTEQEERAMYELTAERDQLKRDLMEALDEWEEAESHPNPNTTALARIAALRERAK